MSIQDVYRAVLIELNKVQAPSILLEDFVYFYNKAVQQYINRQYSVFEMTQQLTDDLRVLLLSHKAVNGVDLREKKGGNVMGGNYECQLPEDYLHILNCICEFQDNYSQPKCGSTVASTFEEGANKLDTSQWSTVINNYYMRPSVKRPYFYIINVNDPYKDANHKNLFKDKLNPSRDSNATTPLMQIKCGNDVSNDPSAKYRLNAVYFDYLRSPEYLMIDQDDLDKVGDDTKVLEFPDYVVYEIINQIVLLVMENAKDQRASTHPQVNTSIQVGLGSAK